MHSDIQVLVPVTYAVLELHGQQLSLSKSLRWLFDNFEWRHPSQYYLTVHLLFKRVCSCFHHRRPGTCPTAVGCYNLRVPWPRQLLLAWRRRLIRSSHRPMLGPEARKSRKPSDTHNLLSFKMSMVHVILFLGLIQFSLALGIFSTVYIHARM